MIKALLFDLNGTVIDILTDDSNNEIYHVLSNLLDYQGIKISTDELREKFWSINKRQRRESHEQYPEFDVIAIFKEIINDYSTSYTQTLPPDKLKYLPLFLAETFRAASRWRLELYPQVRAVLDNLRTQYHLSAVSDGQSSWAIPELNSVGLLEYFDPVLVSSDLGYRKPDMRMFNQVLDYLKMTADEVIFVGNDMYRDIWGAQQLGMQTIFFQSNQGDHKNHGADPDYIIYDFSELPTAVKFIENKVNAVNNNLSIIEHAKS